MTRLILFIFIMLLQTYVVNAQKTLYDYIELGKFQIGFKDTIVYDPRYQYEAFDYVGMKPNFIQIWYPLADKIPNPDYMNFEDFFEGNRTEKLIEIQKQLKTNYQEALIRDCIEENLATAEANDFGTFSYEDVLRSVGKTKTKSILHNDFQASQFPVMLYHHGAQSYSFENFALAEYFASRGFIFIASNFHLPYEALTFGLKPYNQIIKNEEEQSLKAILKFAKSLSSSNSVFFVGHSWGAQMGFRTFDEETDISGFISLETTIEFKSDQEKIREIWPEVYQKVSIEKVSYPFPVLLCAATGQEEPFVFFENLNASQVIFAPTKAEFEHDAYLSSFYMRLFLNDSIVQSDKEILQDRLFLYVKHLKLMSEFIDEILKAEYLPKKEIRFVKVE
ncbi:MAG: hypothetical protein PHG67_01510 [Bacteroidales bacterium]|nr:hypothetical protein [Bacteroidales bacterium]